MNLASILGIIAALPQIEQFVASSVEQVENIAGNVGGISGSQKFEAVKQKVNTFLSEAGADAAALASVSTIIGPMINATVAMLNSLGIFKKAPSPASAAAVAK